MADPIYVYPVVQSAQVDTAHTCDILICPDCLDPARAVDDWRAKVRSRGA